MTSDWWEKTEKSRKNYRNKLKNGEETFKDYDEIMLKSIIKDSGLPEPPKQQHLWAEHGIHLGRWRDLSNAKRNKVGMDAYAQIQAQKVLEDVEFMQLIEKCSTHIPSIGTVFSFFKTQVGGKNGKT